MTIQEAYSKLEQSFEQFQGQEDWKNYLDFSARFHDYSLNNAVLIYTQKPNARFVRGYRSLQELGRQVRKGEKAIKIFAPLIKKEENSKGKKETTHKGI